MGEGNTPCAVAQAPAELEAVAVTPSCKERLSVQTSNQLTALLNTEPVKEGPSDELLSPSPAELGTTFHASPVRTPRSANSSVPTPATSNVDCTPCPPTIRMGATPVPATLRLASPGTISPTRVLIRVVGATPNAGLTVPQTTVLPQATTQEPFTAVSRVRLGRSMKPRKLFAFEADSQQQPQFTAAAASEAAGSLTGNNTEGGVTSSSPESPRPVSASSEVGPVSSSCSLNACASKSSPMSQTLGLLDAGAMSPKPSKSSPVLGSLTGPSPGQAAAAQQRQPAGAVLHCCYLIFHTPCKDAVT